MIGVKPVTFEEHPFYLERDPGLIKQIRAFLKSAFQGSKKIILRMPEEDDTFLHIELIHRKALKSVIQKNQDLQSFVMNKFGNLDSFFSYLQSESIFTALNGNDFLLGLVLGYGRDNAEYYCRRSILGEYLGKFQIEINAPFLTHPDTIITGQLKGICFFDAPLLAPAPKLRKGFASLEAEWEWIRKVEWDLGKQCKLKPPYYVRLPFYICRYGGDSESVREKYIKASGRLASLFCNRSFTEAISKEAVSEP